MSGCYLSNIFLNKNELTKCTYEFRMTNTILNISFFMRLLLLSGQGLYRAKLKGNQKYYIFLVRDFKLPIDSCGGQKISFTEI